MELDTVSMSINKFEHQQQDDPTLNSGEDIKPVRKYKIYPQKFRDKWLADPICRAWLGKVDENRAICKVCNYVFRAHYADIRKHATAKKHINNVQNCDGNFSSFSISDYVNIALGGEPRENSAAGMDTSARPAKIGFIGSGNMSQALLGGFLKNGLAEASNVIVSAPSYRNLKKLEGLGVQTTNDNNSVLNKSDVVFLCVKPHIISDVMATLELEEEEVHNPLFVSVMAGISLAALEGMLEHIVAEPRVIRIMPNTPCMVLTGCCVYSRGSNVSESEGNMIKCLMSSIGLCEEIPESQINAAGALVGSGPAFVYAAIEALADGAVKMGLPRTLATAFASQTVKGAATMVLQTGKHPAQLKDEVCSPGGTTIAGMHQLEKNGLRNSLISAVEAAALRAKELA